LASWLFVLLAFGLPALAQNHEHLLLANQTLVPGTVYYAPAGRMNQDSAWYPLSTNDRSPQFASLLLKADSSTGYTTATAMRIELYCGSRFDTLHYIVPDTAAVVANLTFTADPADTCWLLPVPFYLCPERHYRITVSDTILLDTLREISGR
jgi:hypothetical protein